jgi:hypothetical protein
VNRAGISSDSTPQLHAAVAGQRAGVAESKRTSHIFLSLFLVLLAAYCGWVLMLPVFPSLDGSLHLYYASVLGSLLSGSNTFSSYYFVRHILPPYALHYYFLIAAASFFGWVWADKLLVCTIFLVTAFGFRYLTRQLGPGGGVLSLVAVPLVLTWPLGMGFYNYCLAIGIALWALGMWYRAVSVRSHLLWIGFLVLVCLLVLTHPVPALLVYVLVGIDVAWRIWKEWRLNLPGMGKANRLWKKLRWDAIYMLLAWSTFLNIARFIGTHRVVGNLTQTYPRKRELLRLAKLSTLAMFSGSQPAVVLYRLSLYLILVLSIALALRGIKERWRNRSMGRSDGLLVCSVLLLVLIPILPPVMNGANYFAQRLMILAWFGALAAACGPARMPARTEGVIAICLFAYGIGILAFANARIAPVAAQIAQIEMDPSGPDHMTGLVLGLPDAPDPSDLNYVPFYWTGTRYFRRTKSILLNGGWLYEYYVPLGSRLDQITDQFPQYIQDSPGNAYQLLMASGSARRQVMPHAELVLFTGRSDAHELAAILRILDDVEPARQWECRVRSWYSVCSAPLGKRSPL